MTRLLIAVLRPVVLLLVVEAVTVLLVRGAPGFFADPALLDPHLSAEARARVEQEQATTGSAWTVSLKEDLELMCGRLGVSRYYHVPVSTLIRPRWPVTLALLGGGMGMAWLLACLALLMSLFGAPACTSRVETAWMACAVLLIAVPSGAMAALSVTSGYGSPVTVLAAFTAPRVYRFLAVLLRAQLSNPHIFYARATGIATRRILLNHVLPAAIPEMTALVGTSLIFTLGALVPVEVLFDLPGIAQMAWTSALNRDLPVIAATTLVAAGCVAVAAMLGDLLPARPHQAEARG